MGDVWVPLAQFTAECALERGESKRPVPLVPQDELDAPGTEPATPVVEEDGT